MLLCPVLICDWSWVLTDVAQTRVPSSHRSSCTWPGWYQWQAGSSRISSGTSSCLSSRGRYVVQGTEHAGTKHVGAKCLCLPKPLCHCC
jgi:hypothetical protein